MKKKDKNYTQNLFSANIRYIVEKLIVWRVFQQIDTLMNPLKTSMKSVTQAVKTMPDNMLSTVDGVMDNLSKLFGNPKKSSIFYENTKVGAGLDTEVIFPYRLRVLRNDTVL